MQKAGYQGFTEVSRIAPQALKRAVLALLGPFPVTSSELGWTHWDHHRGTIGTMIEKRYVCICNECGHRWMPVGDASVTQRCAKCKSRRWNDDRDDDASAARGSQAIPPQRTRNDATVPAMRPPEGGAKLLHSVQPLRPELGERQRLDSASAHEGHRINLSARFCIDCKAYF